jgi:hypothetical protein
MQISGQAQKPGISEAYAVKTAMLKDALDGEFATSDNGTAAIRFMPPRSNALTCQSLVRLV